MTNSDRRKISHERGSADGSQPRKEIRSRWQAYFCDQHPDQSQPNSPSAGLRSIRCPRPSRRSTRQAHWLVSFRQPSAAKKSRHPVALSRWLLLMQTRTTDIIRSISSRAEIHETVHHQGPNNPVGLDGSDYRRRADMASMVRPIIRK
jgi:hypothetical protein